MNAILCYIQNIIVIYAFIYSFITLLRRTRNNIKQRKIQNSYFNFIVNKSQEDLKYLREQNEERKLFYDMEDNISNVIDRIQNTNDETHIYIY